MTASATRGGADALVSQLVAEGVEVVFGLPGVQIMPILDALHREPSIEFITTRHEQATTYMADGYARVAGKPGVALVVPGPGVYNAGAGLATAYACSSPVLLLAGQIQSSGIGQGRALTHELDDQLDVVRPVTKSARRVTDAAEIPDAVREAFQAMATGRPRPTEVEIPPDVLRATGDFSPLDPGAFEKDEPDTGLIAAAAELLAGAENPMLVLGGGVVRADGGPTAVAIAEYLQASLVNTREGKGAFDERHPLFVGTAWFNRRLQPLIHRADVVLAVGTRYQGIPLGPGQRLVHLDVDPGEFGKNVEPAIAIEADARVGLEALLAQLRQRHAPQPDRTSQRAADRTGLLDQFRAIGPQLDYTNALRRALPDDAVLVAGTTSAAYMCHLAFPVHRPRGYITSSYMGTLGYGLPTALGAKVAAGDSPVVSVNGDGGFMYCCAELATAVQYGIRAITFVFNDNAFGNTNRDQVENYGGRVIGTELHNPDFVAFAESFGVVGMRAKSPEDVEAALREALTETRPVLIEVPMSRNPSIF
jgi:acetolactate synthase-1/2/3 large subunit